MYDILNTVPCSQGGLVSLKFGLCLSIIAEPSTYCQPKLIVDQGVQESTEIWEDLSGPAFHPEKLLAEASYMMYFFLYFSHNLRLESKIILRRTPANLSRSKRIQFKETERQRLRGRESSSDSSKSNRYVLAFRKI